ncbi:MAG: hypothetical protein K2Q01_12095, partial [Rickettsiales bacterium]|nr:hypothetical protein [Rickettsiales bacterium]
MFGSIIALALLFTYPPLQSPHEAQHYLRGLTFSTLYKDGSLPRSIFQFVWEVEYKANPDSGDITTSKTFPFVPESMYWGLLKEARRPYVSESNAAVYPFVNYVPQMAAGTLGDLFQLRPFTIYHLSRLFCMVLGIVGGYIILRMLPGYHMPVLVALLLPSGWVMRIQQYADLTVLLSAFFYFLLLMRVLASRVHVGR